MSVGMAGFEGRAEELDAVDVARRASRLIWDARLRIWPYLLALAVVETAVRAAAQRYGYVMDDGYGYGFGFRGGETLAEFGRHGMWLGARAVAVGVVLAMTLRGLVGYSAPPWRPDRGLLGFTAIHVAASTAPLMLFLPTVLAWETEGTGGLPLVVALALSGACAFFALLYFYLRLMIWPVGVAVQDPAMTAARSWQAMLGARVAWLFAGVILMLPLILGAALAGAFAMGLYGVHGPAAGPWGGPLHALGSVLWLAVTAAVYRLRAGLEG
jgi:hypothetical protein